MPYWAFFSATSSKCALDAAALATRPCSVRLPLAPLLPFSAHTRLVRVGVRDTTAKVVWTVSEWRHLGLMQHVFRNEPRLFDARLSRIGSVREDGVGDLPRSVTLGQLTRIWAGRKKSWRAKFGYVLLISLSALCFVLLLAYHAMNVQELLDQGLEPDFLGIVPCYAFLASLGMGVLSLGYIAALRCRPSCRPSCDRLLGGS